MNPKKLIPLLLPVMLLVAMPSVNAQVTVSGSIQSDILVPQDDDKIGTEHSVVPATSVSAWQVRVI